MTGKGVTGRVDGSTVALGNARLLAESAHRSASSTARAEQFRRDGATALFVAIDGTPRRA